ncbi:MAG: flagellar biosynthesis protein FlhF, partial [Alcaligenaceae bacterium]|nr:flagellar biosynthesis protein FlhF [Alcaligenaceae bacterium]
ALRGALESRIDELLWGSQLRQAPPALALFQSLLGFGFSTALLRAMIQRMPDQPDARAALQWARAELIKHLPALPDEDALWQPGLALALVGPTGVGKTTTLAKLAARCVRRSGPDSLVLLTTDTYRIGAHEQLKIYGQMLHVPVHVVQDAQELRRIVSGIRPAQTILIDNVGISQRDRYVNEQAALLAGAGRPIKRLLVLNASSHGDTLDEVARSYTRDGGPPLGGCIITKLDEAGRIGAALDTSIRYRLPIHYVSNGQKVPEHLLFLTSAELVDRSLAHEPSGAALFTPTEADMAALLSVTKARADENDAREQQGRKALLAGLLSVSAQQGRAELTLTELQAAAASVDIDPVLAEGYELWRTHQSGSLPMAADQLALLARTASDDLADREAACVFVAHGRTVIETGSRRGTWLSSAWLDDAGRALAAADQRLGFSDGWYGAAPGTGGLEATTVADALIRQVDSVAVHDMPAPVVHLVDGAGQGVLRKLSGRGHCWLASCGAKTRVHDAEGAATISAVSRNFAFQPLRTEDYPALETLVGLARSHAVLWAGSGLVRLIARGSDPIDALAVGLRIVDGRDGRLLREFHGLAYGTADLDAARLACALLIRADHQAALRQAAMIFSSLSDGRDANPLSLLDQAVYAAHQGLASWRLRQGPELAQAAATAARLQGGGRGGLSAGRAYAGLMKLYALKGLMAW